MPNSTDLAHPTRVYSVAGWMSRRPDTQHYSLEPTPGLLASCAVGQELALSVSRRGSVRALDDFALRFRCAHETPAIHPAAWPWRRSHVLRYWPYVFSG